MRGLKSPGRLTAVTVQMKLAQGPLCGVEVVESRCGAVGLGSAYLLPALSAAGASLSGPCSVSTSRSSNRTGLFQASGSRRRLTP
jgi:hypothetical protein